LAFGIALVLGRRNVGHGLGFVLAVGCIYGWLRANFVDGFTHFCFDAALGGLYLGCLPRLRKSNWLTARGSLAWTVLLMAWPCLVICLSPFLDAQHFFVQIVGLRTAALFVPLILLGAVLGKDDLASLTSWSEWCVLGASLFTVGELVLGLDEFFPINELTQLIYASSDVAGGFYRIPSSFISAHAYGGTMVGLMPLLLGRLEEARPRRWLALFSIALASLGVFVCGARLSVLLFGCVIGGSLIRFRKNPLALLILIVGMAGVGYTVSQSSRLRRYETLADAEMVGDRVAASVNMGFWDILGEHPMGRGLGSAVGTSIPYFLAEYARPPVGTESEYARLLLEEGIPGLLIWLCFVASVLGRSFRVVWREGAQASGMWLFCAGTWISGLIGAGILASIPGTMLVMVYFGELSLSRSPRGTSDRRLGVQFPVTPSEMLGPF
jgi:hypothetical protein